MIKTILQKTLKVIFSLTLILIATESYGQTKIVIELQNSSDSTFYLARYFGEKFQLVDTSLHLKGKAVFERSTNLPQGIYILTNSNKNRLIEFLIGQDQSFTLQVSESFNPAEIRCRNSAETALFFSQLAKTNQVYQLIKDLESDSTSRKNTIAHQKTLDSLNHSLMAYRQKIIDENKGSLMSAVIQGMKEPEVPDSIMHNQQASYRFYKNRYWQHYDFEDDRLLYTPLLASKLQKYFEQLVAPVADSIIPEIDMLIQKSTNNLAVRDYLIWYFTEEYQNPKVMGLDKVFVHLADEYFAKLDISNTTSSIRKKVLERANQLRNLILGAPAPNLILVDTTDVFRSFNEINSEYLILFFWDFECGICKKELKQLKNLYDEKKYPLEVFAIGANSDFEGWKRFIRENELNWVNVNGMKSVTADFHDLYDIYGTPVIYLLDQNKKIIGKRINVDQIGVIIDHEMTKEHH